jgi:hypothetical protein
LANPSRPESGASPSKKVTLFADPAADQLGLDVYGEGLDALHQARRPERMSLPADERISVAREPIAKGTATGTRGKRSGATWHGLLA